MAKWDSKKEYEIYDLKEIYDIHLKNYQGSKYALELKDRIQKEVIKWIREDIETAKKQESGVDTKMIVQCMKWAKRFNLDLEDIK